jgi:transcriptional regulator with XRE-family HTH domain
VSVGTDPGAVIKALRTERNLSLRALAKMTGMPYSTLSKLENGKMALTYVKLAALAQALEVDIGELVATRERPDPLSPIAMGRRSIARADSDTPGQSPQIRHNYVAADLLGKQMEPVIIDVRASSVEEVGGLIRHSGEEYLYVLSGSMELHSELYAPLRLDMGDSIYFDSSMAHCYVRVGEERCRVLSVCTGTTIQQLAGVVRQERAPPAADDA